MNISKLYKLICMISLRKRWRHKTVFSCALPQGPEGRAGGEGRVGPAGPRGERGAPGEIGTPGGSGGVVSSFY